MGLDTMPGINSLLGMIKTRRRRDAVILGLVIGLCFILLFSYMSSLRIPLIPRLTYYTCIVHDSTDTAQLITDILLYFCECP